MCIAQRGQEETVRRSLDTKDVRTQFETCSIRIVKLKLNEITLKH